MKKINWRKGFFRITVVISGVAAAMGVFMATTGARDDEYGPFLFIAAAIWPVYLIGVYITKGFSEGR